MEKSVYLSTTVGFTEVDVVVGRTDVGEREYSLRIGASRVNLNLTELLDILHMLNKIQDEPVR